MTDTKHTPGLVRRIAMKAGQRVLVLWDRRGWLPGTFESYSSPDIGEKFRRCRVHMDNGFACHDSGFHPDCVKAFTGNDQARAFRESGQEDRIMNDTVKSTLAPEAPDLPAWRRVAALERDREELIEALHAVLESVLFWQPDKPSWDDREFKSARALLSRLEKDRT